MPNITSNKPVTMEQARNLVCTKQPFMSNLVHALTLVEADYIPTMGTDGENLFWNPEFLKTLSEEQAAAVIFHEVMHCAMVHMWRKGKRDHMKFNIACDYAINPMVSDAFQLPPGALISRKYYNLDAETIYDRLPKPPKQKSNGTQEEQQQGSGSGQGQQSSAGDEKSEEKKNGSVNGEKKESQKKGKQKDNSNGESGDKKEDKKSSGLGEKGENKNEGQKEQPWGDHDFWGKEGEERKKEIDKKRSLVEKALGTGKVPKSDLTEEQKERKWKKLFQENITKEYGKLPNNLQRLVEKTHRIPVIDWVSLISNLLTADESDYNFSQPDRRFMEQEFIIPGLYSQEKLQDVIFAYDTSGSITQEDLKDFYNETLSLFNNFSNIHGHIAVCDAQLHDFFEINIDKSFEELRFRGGGGTAFEPVFKEIEKRNLNPKAVFYFTDTYGSFPKDPGYPVFWLVKSQIVEKSYARDYDVPFGKVIEFMPKEK